jgi:cellulose biosynthesis protein BcsQ
LTDTNAQRVLRLSDGIVLTCLAEPLSLRTIPAATKAIQQARQVNDKLQLLGLLIGIYNGADEFQSEMLSQLRRQQGELLLEPPIPYQQEVCDWPLSPGSDLPTGAAREAFESVSEVLESLMGPAASWRISPVGI